MKLEKYIPDFEDCIDIPITKHTWVWIQNNTYKKHCDDDEINYRCELHHDDDYETLVTMDFLELNGEETKKNIIEEAIEQAIVLLPQLFDYEVERNLDCALHIWETLKDIYYSAKKNDKYGSLGHYMKSWRKEK